jgi:hypothetical protein
MSRPFARGGVATEQPSLWQPLGVVAGKKHPAACGQVLVSAKTRNISI